MSDLETKKLHYLIQNLEEAISSKNKGRILFIYEASEKVDLESVSDKLFTAWDELVDQANGVLEDE